MSASERMILEEELDELHSEIERLRQINDDYLLEMGRQLALLRDQKRGENAERAAVVAWLRRKATDGFVSFRINEACAAEKLADLIERGEHLKES